MKKISQASFFIALLLIGFVFANIFVSSALFIAHVSISPLQPIVATLFTVIFGSIVMREKGLRLTIGVFIAVTLLIASSIYITAITSDDTADGPSYHMTAVGAMRYGWNPVYEHIGDFNKSGKSPIRLENTYYEKWNNHYPKAHWIFGANIYSITHKIETGRSMALLIMLTLFFAVLHYALTRFKPGMAVTLATAAALNPISSSQLFSYYNDGMVGNLLFVLILFLTMLIDKKYAKFSWLHYALIAMSLVLIVNLKFTGLFYAVVYGITYFGFIVINKPQRHLIKPLLITGIAAVVVGLFVVGLSTYPKNLIEKGNPLHPLIGGDSTDIITESEPYSFHDMRSVKKLFMSNFSKMDNISASSDRNPELKIPFTFDLNELKYLSYVDARIAGYGVWFSGVLVLSLAWLVYLALRASLLKHWKSLWYIALPVVPTAIIAVSLSESWWARYFPQLFLLPVVALVSMLLLKRAYFANVLVFTLLFNSILILSLQIAGQKEGLAYRASEEKSVDNLLENGSYKPKLYLGPFNGLAYRYQERYGSVIILPEKLKDDEANASLTLAKDITVYK